MTHRPARQELGIDIDWQLCSVKMTPSNHECEYFALVFDGIYLGPESDVMTDYSPREDPAISGPKCKKVVVTDADWSFQRERKGTFSS